jgi:hypothetical protein
MREQVIKEQGRIFHEQWETTAASSYSIADACLFPATEITANSGKRWSQAMNILAGLYYAQEGWKTNSKFRIPPSWRSDAITDMIEKMLRTSHYGYGEAFKKKKQEQPQQRLSTGPPLSEFVILSKHDQQSKGRDGPGKSRLVPSAGMQPHARRQFTYDCPTSTATSSMLMQGAAPLRADEPRQTDLQMPHFDAEDDIIPSLYCQVVLGNADQVEMSTMEHQEQRQETAANNPGDHFMA